MKTIAQQLNIKVFPFDIKDSKGNQIYFENSNGFWHKLEYDLNKNIIYCELSDGFWKKVKFDLEGNVIYYENSNGIIKDSRFIELSQKKIDKLTEIFESAKSAIRQLSKT